MTLFYRNRDVKKISLLMASLFIFALPVWLGASEDAEPTLEEISQTEAAQFFVAQQYPESLEAFKVLERQYPQSAMIKRYMASLYDRLQDWDQALQKLREALAVNPNDLIARQMEGEIFIRKASFAEARRSFETLQEKDKEGPFGQYAVKRLEAIRDIENAAQTVAGEKMSVQDFMKSGPAQNFSKGLIEEALAGFDELLEQYPEDVLIRRFKAIALMRLEEYPKALEVLQEAQQLDPGNVAVRFYKGQAFSGLKKMEEAREEFRWIIQNDTSDYRMRAQQAMFQTLGGAQQNLKPWTLSVSQGYEFDTNAIYKSNDREYTVAGDKNSSRYATMAVGTYRFFQKGKWFLTGDSFYAQSLYDDFPILNTYTPGMGISALYIFNLLGKPAFLNVREGAMATYLKNKFYVWSNSLSPTLIYNFHPRHKTSLSYRYSVNEFDNNGLTPDTTSRDGISNFASITNTHYFDDEKDFYATTGYDFEKQDTSGVSYIKYAHGFKLGLHKTLVEKLEGEIVYTLKDSDFPKYAETQPLRHDDVHNLTVTLSRAIWGPMTLSAIYTLEDARAKNNAYEYTRHVFGTKLELKY